MLPLRCAQKGTLLSTDLLVTVDAVAFSQQPLRPAASNLARVWSSYSEIQDLETDFADIKAHSVDLATIEASIIIEPPVYNRTFAYNLGSSATGRQIWGEPIGHYYPDMLSPVHAEVVPLKAYDGQQHLQIVAAKIATPGAGL